MRDAGSAVLSATEPIICLNGGWNEYGSNAGTRWHRDAFVGKTQTAARAAFGMGQTLQMLEKIHFSMLNQAEPKLKGASCVYD